MNIMACWNFDTELGAEVDAGICLDGHYQVVLNFLYL